MKNKLNFSGQFSAGLALRSKLRVGLVLTDRMRDCQSGHDTRKQNCADQYGNPLRPDTKACINNSWPVFESCLKEWAGLSGDQLAEAITHFRYYVG